ncbi:MAG: SRPBCC family protein [Bacteroidales bacterium]|nr:SRPBCC family protein [Bacteroidales bacterium]
MKITKSIEINKNSGLVFDYLRITKNQDNFSVWNMSDPDMKKTHLGNDGTVGFIYSWDSTMKNVGAGEQVITAIEEGKSIEYSIRFFRPMKNTGKTKFEITSIGKESTSVAWIFDSPSKFPMSLFSPIFKKMLGKDLEKGLINLKRILEKK